MLNEEEKKKVDELLTKMGMDKATEGLKPPPELRHSIPRNREKEEEDEMASMTPEQRAHYDRYLKALEDITKTLSDAHIDIQYANRIAGIIIAKSFLNFKGPIRHILLLDLFNRISKVMETADEMRLDENNPDC